jgi:hypothetical protein
MPSKAPNCPWCAKRMTYVRTTPAASGGQRTHHYECKRCIVLYTELDRDGERRPERVRKLDRQPIHTLQ